MWGIVEDKVDENVAFPSLNKVNPPCWSGGGNPHSWGALGLLDSPKEVSLVK